MRVGLIGNVNAVFPLLDWLHSQGVLAGVSIVEENNEYFKNFGAYCSQKQIQATVFRKTSINNQLQDWLMEIKPDLVFVMGFSYKIKKEVLSLPKHGFFNIHFGKLPNYGGPSPVFWQIKNQETQITLTIHQMDENYDTGPIACELNLDLNPQSNFGMVELNFGYAAINGVYLIIDAILRDTLSLIPQSNRLANYFKKPTLSDIIINWQKMNAAQIVALVKACNPWNNGAITSINGYSLKILEATALEYSGSRAGEVLNLDENHILVGCIDGSALNIKLVSATIGFLAGETLASLGLKKGDVFGGV